MGKLGVEGALDERCGLTTLSWCTPALTLASGGHRWAHLNLRGNHPTPATTCGVTAERRALLLGLQLARQLDLGRPDVDSIPVPVRVPDPL